MYNEFFKKLQDQLEYAIEANRLKTFKSWVFSVEARCSAVKLAEAGFIYIGTNKTETDLVKCFLCNKQLDCWEEHDDPWKEHRKHNASCSFAQMDKPERSFTLTEFMDIRNELIENIVKETLNKELEQVDSQFDEMIQLIKSQR